MTENDIIMVIMGHPACTSSQTIGEAEAVVKRMLGRFGQTLDAGKLRTVAIKMVRTLPKPSI